MSTDTADSLPANNLDTISRTEIQIITLCGFPDKLILIFFKLPYNKKLVKYPACKRINNALISRETIRDKKANAPRGAVQLPERSQVKGQFCLDQCKGMSGSAALHIFCNQASKKCHRKLVMNQMGVQL